LARLGYRVWAPDLRGYGDSERPLHMQDYAIERLLDDVAGLIDASRARSTLLIAHDWGAVIAWLFATRRVRPLDGLVIMNVALPALVDRKLIPWRQLLRFWYVALFQLPRLPESLLGAQHCRRIGEAFRRSAVDPSKFPDEVVQVYRDNAARPGAL